MDDELIVGINVTPLVDIVLVLLVIMMVTAAYVTAEAIPMETPGEAATPAAAGAALRIEVDPGGFTVDGAAVSRVELKARIRGFRASGGEQAVIAGAVDATHGQVVAVIDTLRRERVVRIAFEPPR